MNVAFEKVTRRKAVSLRRLAPMRIMMSVGDERVESLAAVDKEKASGYVIGVIQYSYSDNICQLNWIYVDTEYRGNGIGKAMLEYLYKEALEKRIRELRCLIYQGVSLNVNVNELSDFLISAGFDVKDNVDGLNCIFGKDLLKSFSLSEMNKLQDYSKSTISFSELTPDEIVQSAKSLGVKNTEDILAADRNLSCMYISGGECMGMVTFTKKGHLYSLSQFKASDETALKRIFWNTLYNSFKHLRVNDNIVIELNKKQEALLNRVLPGIIQKDAVLVTKEM